MGVARSGQKLALAGKQPRDRRERYRKTSWPGIKESCLPLRGRRVPVRESGNLESELLCQGSDSYVFLEKVAKIAKLCLWQD
jgi:hypothetical protein